MSCTNATRNGKTTPVTRLCGNWTLPNTHTAAVRAFKTSFRKIMRTNLISRHSHVYVMLFSMMAADSADKRCFLLTNE